MAAIQLQTPDCFNFKTPDEWPQWRKQFKQFYIGSGLSSQSDDQLINTLLYCLGEDTEDVLMSTGILDKDRKKYAQVLAKFDSFFQPCKNIIFERASFNRRQQAEGESAEQFIIALYHLASTCNYGPLQDEMIRDRLVVKIRDSANCSSTLS